jgi:hypothetical protein
MREAWQEGHFKAGPPAHRRASTECVVDILPGLKAGEDVNETLRAYVEAQEKPA